MSASVANMVTDALCGLARSNWYEFAKDSRLCRRFIVNATSRKHLYRSDRSTCGFADCWSSYRALVIRYQTAHGRFCQCSDPICKKKRALVAARPGVILLDCEDAACAVAGWLASQCNPQVRLLVGLVPGKVISHAIYGIQKKSDDSVIVRDPARWAGMGETTYENPVWRDIATKLPPTRVSKLILPPSTQPPSTRSSATAQRT